MKLSKGTKLTLSSSGLIVYPKDEYLNLILAIDYNGDFEKLLMNSEFEIHLSQTDELPFIVIKISDSIYMDTPLYISNKNIDKIQKYNFLLVDKKTGVVVNSIHEDYLSSRFLNLLTELNKKVVSSYPSRDLANIRVETIYKEYSSAEMSNFSIISQKSAV